MIKYKGEISNLLTDLSLEFGNTVDLKTSEIILKLFFKRILEKASIEQKIEIISKLPTHLKPFCQSSKSKMEIEPSIFHSENMKKTTYSILKILEKYIPSESLTIVYSSLPENTLSEIPFCKKLVILAA